MSVYSDCIKEIKNVAVVYCSKR